MKTEQTEQNVPLTDASDLPSIVNQIEAIQRKSDGSYLVVCNGYPFHATEHETPDIYLEVAEAIKQGSPVTEYQELEHDKPNPLAIATAEYNRLRGVADFKIAPLQDAVDLEEATDAEQAALKAWKKYRVALNRVSDQPAYPQAVEWPIVPQ